MITKQDQPRGEAEGAGDQAGEQEPADRLAPAQMGRQHAGGIGAGAEIGGVAEGNDAGIAEDEIEREGENDGDDDLGAQRHVIGKDEECTDARHPGKGLGPMPTVAADEARACSLARGLLGCGHHALPNSPFGRTRRTATVTA